jgi:hypothetical protein
LSTPSKREHSRIVYPIENNAELPGQSSAVFGCMIIAAASRVTSAISKVTPLIGIAVASIALVTAICPIAVARNPELPSADTLIPVQLSMGTGPVRTPPMRKRMSAPVPAKPEGGLTPEEQKQLTEMIRRMPSGQRKRLAKAMKSLTPEERQQLVGAVKRSLAGQGPASQAMKRAR